jgi:hypothetical protein
MKKSRNIAGFFLGFPEPVGKELPPYLASKPRRSQNSSTSRRKPESRKFVAPLKSNTDSLKSIPYGIHKRAEVFTISLNYMQYGPLRRGSRATG